MSLLFKTIECDGNNIGCDVMKQRDVVTSKDWMSNKPLFAKETKQSVKDVLQSFSSFTCQCMLCFEFDLMVFPVASDPTT
jgi:hypothetical protein